MIKANILIKENIDALLRSRHQTRKDLAQWCHRGESWISKIFRNDLREIPTHYWDRIADFFGLSTYQLLQPGISHRAERRIGSDRRAGKERRIGQSQRVMLATAAEIDAHRPSRKGAPHVAVVASSPLIDALERASAEHARRIIAIHAQFTDVGGQAPNPRRKHAAVSKVRRVAGRPAPQGE